MAKFSGAVGFATPTETKPGVWTDVIAERTYFGDLVHIARTLQETTSVNGVITTPNSISIVADAYANENFFAIRYVRWMGALWLVTNVEVQRPRLVLRLGGAYNGPKPA